MNADRCTALRLMASRKRRQSRFVASIVRSADSSSAAARSSTVSSVGAVIPSPILDWDEPQSPTASDQEQLVDWLMRLTAATRQTGASFNWSVQSTA